MWDEFEDYPMRKDYREPDDYEYEPTPHDDVLEKGKTTLHAAAAIGRRGKYHGATEELTQLKLDAVQPRRCATCNRSIRPFTNLKNERDGFKSTGSRAAGR